MTSIVGIRCTDGIVIGADSSATFGDGQIRIIEQPTDKKIEIIEGRLIVAGTGYVGHSQRFVEVVREAWRGGKFKGKSGIDFGKELSLLGVNDFAQTLPGPHLRDISYSAFVAYPAKHEPYLCELSGRLGFQPEIKDPRDLWFASTGSGQTITDPLLALFRSVFWRDGPPNLQGGIFTALWALRHTCEVNPGGIKEPIKVAVLAKQGGEFVARMLSDDELQEHGNMVDDATEYMRKYRDVLMGKLQASAPPKPA